MSEDILSQVRLFVDAVVFGCLLTVLYDVLLILRKVFHHNTTAVSIEDALYWLFTSAAAFFLLYKVNAGVVRWFFIAGALVGMLLYKKSLSELFVKVMSTIVSYIVKIIKFVAHIVYAPLKWLVLGIKWMLAKLKKFVILIKKKLTVCIKLVKITLCKRE